MERPEKDGPPVRPSEGDTRDLLKERARDGTEMLAAHGVVRERVSTSAMNSGSASSTIVSTPPPRTRSTRLLIKLVTQIPPASSKAKPSGKQPWPSVTTAARSWR